MSAIKFKAGVLQDQRMRWLAEMRTGGFYEAVGVVTVLWIWAVTHTENGLFNADQIPLELQDLVECEFIAKQPDGKFRVVDYANFISNRRKADPIPLDDSPVVLEIPCVGKRGWWQLREAKLKEYTESFPEIDVLTVIRKARQWSLDNPKRCKTYDRISSWLVNVWLTGAKAHERGTKEIGESQPRRGKYARSGETGEGALKTPPEPV